MKETKVYVDELPEDCTDCPCYDFDVGGCQCQNAHVSNDEINRFNGCPLIDIKDHYRELVAKVFEKIKSKFNYYELVDEIKEEIDFDKMKNYILDQMQKEFEDE